MLTCTPCKDAPLTYGHVITIIAKALNVDLSAYTRKVECSYFTNHALVRGEVCDAGLKFIPARSHSCWRGIIKASRVDKPPTTSEYKSKSDSEEELPQYQPFGEVPLLTYPLQSVSGSSSEHPPIWDQILNNQIAMQGQLNAMEHHQKQMTHRQRKMEYKLSRYFAQTGYSIESPPTTPSDD